MKNRILFSTATLSVVIAIIAWNSPSFFNSAPINSHNDSSIDTASAVVAASWSDNVTITLDEEAKTFRFQSNGIPSHGFAEKYLIPKNPNQQPFSDKPASAFTVASSAEFFKETQIDTTITTAPNYVEKVTSTSLGRIGVALSGAQIFNDYENMDRSVVAKDDQVIHDHVSFLDECNGHTLVDGSNYHYHGVPVCITQGLDSADAHSVMVGVLEDGFPVYGNLGLAGAIVTNDDLDACSGHVEATPEFPQGIYHYHLSADEAPYMIDCYHGEVDNSGPRGQDGPDFSQAAQTLGLSEEALIQALGNSMPPDFDAAAKTLKINVDDLRAAMPPPQ